MVVLVLAYLAVTFAQVWAASAMDQPGPAEAIVVLGAAQYDGRPSPVLQLRLDHALDLYHQDVAPLLVVTGGLRPGDRFHEAHASATYLQRQGVDPDVILWENAGRNTWEQLAATARFLRARDINAVVLVSDPMHSARLSATAAEVGLSATVSPRESTATVGQRLRSAARETAALAMGRIVGFQRLARLKDRVTAAL